MSYHWVLVDQNIHYDLQLMRKNELLHEGAYPLIQDTNKTGNVCIVYINLTSFLNWKIITGASSEVNSVLNISSSC